MPVLYERTGWSLPPRLRFNPLRLQSLPHEGKAATPLSRIAVRNGPEESVPCLESIVMNGRKVRRLPAQPRTDSPDTVIPAKAHNCPEQIRRRVIEALRHNGCVVVPRHLDSNFLLTLSSFPRKRKSILTLQNSNLDSRFRGNDEQKGSHSRLPELLNVVIPA